MSRSKAHKRKARRRTAKVAEPKHALQAITKERQRSWPMRDLLELGPERGGIDAVQFEAALELSEGFEVVVRKVGFHGCNLDAVGLLNNWHRDSWSELSRRELRLATIYLAWADDAAKRWHILPPTVVEWIDGARSLSIQNVPLLVRALDLWSVHCDRFDPALLTEPKNTLQISGTLSVDEHRISPAAFQSTITTHSAAPQMRAAPVSSHAVIARSTPAARRTR